MVEKNKEKKLREGFYKFQTTFMPTVGPLNTGCFRHENGLFHNYDYNYLLKN